MIDIIYPKRFKTLIIFFDKLALLKEKLYFPPNFELEEDAFEDFMDGEVRGKIEKIEEEINGKS